MNTTAFPPESQALLDRILQICREQMTEGSVTPMTYVINSGKDTMVPVEMYMPNEVAKDVAGALVRWTVKNIQADMTIMVTEAWSLSKEDSLRYDEIMHKYGSIAEYPHHLDILVVTIETRAGNWVGRAPIETKGQARRCGALDVIKADAMGGRFTNFLSEDEAPG